MARVRVLIADYALMRLAVRAALQADAEICAEADGAQQAIVDAGRTQPDVCLLGWEIPGDGLTALRGILEVAPNAGVVMLAPQSNPEDLLSAVRAGALGYLPGSVSRREIRRVVRAVAAKQAVVPPSMVRDLMIELRAGATRRAAGITDREAEVLDMLRRGQSTAEMARSMNISPVTVRRHISDLKRKFDVDDRAALARLDEGSGHAVSSTGARR